MTQVYIGKEEQELREPLKKKRKLDLPNLGQIEYNVKSQSNSDLTLSGWPPPFAATVTTPTAIAPPTVLTPTPASGTTQQTRIQSQIHDAGGGVSGGGSNLMGDGKMEDHIDSMHIINTTQQQQPTWKHSKYNGKQLQKIRKEEKYRILFIDEMCKFIESKIKLEKKWKQEIESELNDSEWYKQMENETAQIENEFDGLRNMEFKMDFTAVNGM